MTPPGVAAGRFAAALALGIGLGIVYAFLRPLGRRRWPWDLCFTVCALWVWAELSFRICRGDIRMAELLGLAAGVMASIALFGTIFTRFWKIMAIPAKKISEIAKK